MVQQSSWTLTLWKWPHSVYTNVNCKLQQNFRSALWFPLACCCSYSLCHFCLERTSFKKEGQLYNSSMFPEFSRGDTRIGTNQWEIWKGLGDHFTANKVDRRLDSGIARKRYLGHHITTYFGVVIRVYVHVSESMSIVLESRNNGSFPLSVTTTPAVTCSHDDRDAISWSQNQSTIPVSTNKSKATSTTTAYKIY